MSKTWYTNILYASNNFSHGLVSSVFSFSRIQSPNVFFKFLFPQSMLWDECCDTRLLPQHFFLPRLSGTSWAGAMIRLSLSSQPNLSRSGHKDLPSVPPFPCWDLLVLRGAQCPGHGWPTHHLVHNDEVSELKEMEGTWRGEQEKQVFMFWEAHC